jgi:hypothetical protein
MAISSRPSVLVSLTAALAVALGACASNQGDTAPAASPTAAAEASPAAAPATPPGDATMQCSAAAAQSFVGREASDTTVAEAQAAAGATGTVRVIKPGQPVTMDFRGDRLNVEVDERNAIVRITCG